MLKPEVNYRDVRHNLLSRQCKQRFYYDRKTKSLRPLNSNENVLMKHKNKWVKCKVIKKRDELRSYVVQKNFLSRPNTYVRNIYHVKPFYKSRSRPPSRPNPNLYPVYDEIFNYRSKGSSPVKNKSPTKSPEINISTSSQSSPPKQIQTTPKTSRYTTRSGRVVKALSKMDL